MVPECGPEGEGGSKRRKATTPPAVVVVGGREGGLIYPDIDRGMEGEDGVTEYVLRRRRPCRAKNHETYTPPKLDEVEYCNRPTKSTVIG